MFEELQLGWGCVSRQFDYVVGTFTDEHKDNGKLKSTPTTQLVSRITFADGRTIEYEYDAEERITKVIDSVDGEWVYTYDALGQLLTETVNGVVVNAMTYDNYGNILTKNGKPYAYDSVWKDKLISYDGNAIDYDAQGNPTSYFGHTLTWEKGRQLKSFGDTTYTYNANGIRTSKTVNGVEHKYVLDGTKILSESVDTLITYVHYDNEGSICRITYNGTPYYFLKNLQGDIIAITDRDGEVVARYTYDAWGKVLSVTDKNGVAITAPNNIANINPYRYRGYYYDRETGLYYLQSRYYDPETGRFVNADEAETVKLTQNFLYTNLFAYCLNTPINSSDSSGKLTAQIIARIILGAMLGFLIQLLCDLIESWYIVYIQKKKDNRKLCVGDYLSSMLSWSLVFLSPASKTIRAVLALLPYYVKILGRAVNNNYPWQSLLIDLVSALIATIVSVCLGANKVTARQLSKIQARFMGSKNALQKVANTATNLVIRMNKWGFRLNVAVNISNAFMQLLFNILAYKKY